MARGRPGPAPQTAKREQFARLIARGASNAEACRIVGVNPRTGKRWRHGRTITSSSGVRLHYPPVLGARKREISARYLSEDERVVIADLRRHGQTVRGIAAGLGRSPATVSRELRRNRDPDSGQYRPFTAQRLAAGRRARPGRGKLLRDPVLRQFVADRLETRWSPEQISHALRREFPGNPERHVVHETIYQAVYRTELGGLRRDLPRVLRTGRCRRRPHRRPDARRAGSLAGMTMIDQRPAEADSRDMPGHWEGDLITGAANRSGDRHPGRAVEPVHHLAASARRAAYRRSGPGRAGGRDGRGAGAATPFADLGPGQGAGAARRDRPRARHAGVLLPGTLALAAAE